MIEGEYFRDLGFYLLVERSECGIRRIFFSKEAPSKHSELAEQIIRHIEDGAPCPDVKLDLSGLTEFQRKVFSVVRNIPLGEVMTYGDVAAMAGSSRGGRAVGQVMASNPFSIVVPCHRVVAKDGLGGYFWGLDVKRKLLEIEANAKTRRQVSGKRM